MRISNDRQDEVAATMQPLIAITRAIADTTGLDGEAAGGRDRDLDRAAELIESGDDDNDGLRGRNAIDYYRQAWPVGFFPGLKPSSFCLV